MPKGNPSRQPKGQSAAKSARALAQVGSGTGLVTFESVSGSNDVGFDVESGSKAQSSGFDEDLTLAFDARLRGNLKKLYKKDATTRNKALNDLRQDVDLLVENQGVLLYFVRQLDHLSQDVDQRVRLGYAELIGEMAKAAGKSLAPVLKEILPVWLLLQYDSNREVARRATEGFHATFSGEKRPAVYKHAENAICTELGANLLRRSAAEINRNIPCTPEEGRQRYERIFTASFAVLVHLAIAAHRTRAAEDGEYASTVADILRAKKFWQNAGFSGNKSGASDGVKTSVSRNLQDLLEHYPQLVQARADVAEMVSQQIIKILNDTNLKRLVWQLLPALLHAVPDALTHAKSFQKSIVVPLIQQLRDVGQADAESVYPMVVVLMSRIPEELIQKTPEFYWDVLETLNRALFKSTLASEAKAISTAYQQSLLLPFAQRAYRHVLLESVPEHIAGWTIVMKGISSMVSGGLEVLKESEGWSPSAQESLRRNLGNCFDIVQFCVFKAILSSLDAGASQVDLLPATENVVSGVISEMCGKIRMHSATGRTAEAYEQLHYGTFGGLCAGLAKQTVMSIVDVTKPSLVLEDGPAKLCGNYLHDMLQDGKAMMRCAVRILKDTAGSSLAAQAMTSSSSYVDILTFCGTLASSVTDTSVRLFDDDGTAREVKLDDSDRQLVCSLFALGAKHADKIPIGKDNVSPETIMSGMVDQALDALSVGAEATVGLSLFNDLLTEIQRRTFGDDFLSPSSSGLFVKVKKLQKLLDVVLDSDFWAEEKLWPNILRTILGNAYLDDNTETRKREWFVSLVDEETIDVILEEALNLFGLDLEALTEAVNTKDAEVMLLCTATVTNYAHIFSSYLSAPLRHADQHVSDLAPGVVDLTIQFLAIISDEPIIEAVTQTDTGKQAKDGIDALQDILVGAKQTILHLQGTDGKSSGQFRSAIQEACLGRISECIDDLVSQYEKVTVQNVPFDKIWTTMKSLCYMSDALEYPQTEIIVDLIGRIAGRAAESIEKRRNKDLSPQTAPNDITMLRTLQGNTADAELEASLLESLSAPRIGGYGIRMVAACFGMYRIWYPEEHVFATSHLDEEDTLSRLSWLMHYRNGKMHYFYMEAFYFVAWLRTVVGYAEDYRIAHCLPTTEGSLQDWPWVNFQSLTVWLSTWQRPVESICQIDAPALATRMTSCKSASLPLWSRVLQHLFGQCAALDDVMSMLEANWSAPEGLSRYWTIKALLRHLHSCKEDTMSPAVLRRIESFIFREDGDGSARGVVSRAMVALEYVEALEVYTIPVVCLTHDSQSPCPLNAHGDLHEYCGSTARTVLYDTIELMRSNEIDISSSSMSHLLSRAVYLMLSKRQNDGTYAYTFFNDKQRDWLWNEIETALRAGLTKEVLPEDLIVPEDAKNVLDVTLTMICLRIYTDIGRFHLMNPEPRHRDVSVVDDKVVDRVSKAWDRLRTNMSPHVAQQFMSVLAQCGQSANRLLDPFIDVVARAAQFLSHSDVVDSFEVIMLVESLETSLHISQTLALHEILRAFSLYTDSTADDETGDQDPESAEEAQDAFLQEPVRVQRILELCVSARDKGKSPAEYYIHQTSLLLAWDLILEHFESVGAKRKMNIAGHLRKIDALGPIMGFICQRLGLGDDDADLPSITVIPGIMTADFRRQRAGAGIYRPEGLDVHILQRTLDSLPALCRQWWSYQDSKTVQIRFQEFVEKHISPALIHRQLSQVKDQSTVGDDLTVAVRAQTNEVIATYDRDEVTMTLPLSFPSSFPVKPVAVDKDGAKFVGVGSNHWRKWLLQITLFLNAQNGSLLDAFRVWQSAIEKRFEGVEECTICYSVVHGTNQQLPQLRCKTCSNKFHSACLYKWFSTSGQSTCPLCRSLF
eukprot:Clim_evm24s231 gene=Clim_evmTU24s231